MQRKQCLWSLRTSALAAYGSFFLVVVLNIKMYAVNGFSALLRDNNNLGQSVFRDDGKKKSDFSSFDYKKHWYPVSFVHDLPLNKLVKVTVFDTEYAIARTSDSEVIAMVDMCPHKLAALSEGRITANGFIQCSYHGWTFNGTNGSCQQIPQATTIRGGKMVSKGAQSKRSGGTAVPAMVVQSMVFLFPFGNLETALAAPPPPRLPDIREDEPWKMTPVVRDFPVDWPILVENIMDPDHGLFAHGASSFDRYSASNDSPQCLNETSLYEGAGWSITSSVDASLKLIALDKEVRGKPLRPKKRRDSPKVATNTFIAPSLIYQCRRDAKTGKTDFVIPFYITPTGTGRSRFMSAAYYKLPIQIPRWIFNVNINNFLDQDTYLLATQQRRLLALEQAVLELNANETDLQLLNTEIRQKHYVFRSPTERLAARLSAFWDATLNRVPNRIETLRKLDTTLPVPHRSVVLDRDTQHLSICPDSQRLVRNCDQVMCLCRSLLGLTAALKLLVRNADLPKQTFLSVLSEKLSSKNLSIIWSISIVTFWLARKLKREFFFKGTANFHEKDISNIPNVWKDNV